MTETLEYDATGLLCPLPVLRANRKLRELPVGGVLTVRATDPAAEQDFPAYCRQTGHELVSSRARRRGAGIRHPQTLIAKSRCMPQVSFKTIDSVDVSGKRVLVRVDLNVPMKNGKVTDATRIERAAPTLAELAAKGAKVIVLSHFGRPDGKRVPEMSLKPLVEPLSKALGKPVAFAEDCIGPLAEDAVRALKPGEVLLLENLRFHKEEEKNDAAFIDKLSVLGDVYVNDAFSAAHRAHASTEGLANRLPAAAGRLMQAELEALDKALGNPKRPVCAVVGGAKVSTKLDLLGNLVGKVDKLIIGGGMANTFLHAQGIKVGKSLCEKDLAPTALEILAKAKAAKCKVLLPVDVVVAGEFKANAPHQVVDADGLPRRPDDPRCRAEVDRALPRGSSPSAPPWCGTARSAPSR